MCVMLFGVATCNAHSEFAAKTININSNLLSFGFQIACNRSFGNVFLSNISVIITFHFALMFLLVKSTESTRCYETGTQCEYDYCRILLKFRSRNFNENENEILCSETVFVS